MTFDWTIDFGNVVTIVGFVAATTAFVLALRGDLKLLTFRVLSIENTLQSVARVLEIVARQEERITMLSKRIDDAIRNIDREG